MAPPLSHTGTELADYLRDVGPAGIVLFEATPPFRVLSTNKAYLELWPEPFRSRGLVGLALTEFIPDAEQSGVAEVFQQVASTRAPRHIQEFPYSLADGLHWFNWSLVPVIRDGEVVALANMAVDITREVLIRKQLEAERMRWRGVVEGIADEVWVCDAEGTMTLINLPDTTAMGLEAFEGKSIQEVLANVDIFYPDGRPRPPDEAPLLRALRTGEILRGEEIMRLRASGRVRHRQYSCAPMRNEMGVITGAVAIARDITATKTAEAALRAREAEFRALVEELHSGVAVIDSAGKFSVHNRRFLELFGLEHDATVKDVNDQDWAKWQVFDESGTLLHVDDHPVRKAALTRTQVRNQLVAVRVPGAEESDLKWLMISAEPLLAKDGTVERIVCTYHDVTERRRAEDALRESEQRSRRQAIEIRTVLDAVPAGVFIARDAEARRIDANRAGLELLRVAPGRNVSKSAPPVEAPTYRVLRDGVEVPAEELPAQRAARGIEVRDWECEVQFEDGTSREILGYATPLRDDAGTPMGSVTAFVDITERKRAEVALRDANRRKDEFLGMLSHELRNPLAPIRNSMFILQRAAPGSEQARRAQSVIERQTEHLTRLVDDLLDVTRIERGKIELRRSRVDLREVVVRAAEDFRLLMDDRGVVFRTVMPDRKVWSDVDATRMTQVIGNLLHNAAKFTNRGDEVLLTLSTHGAEATITIRDTGAGIDATLLPTVFDPFVQGERTLARTDGGLGLGLALVKGITELHGGSVAAASPGPGRGAEFVVRIPLTDAAVDAATSPTANRRNGGRRVLVVDDNRDAAESLADLVRMLGHEAEVVYDGPTAVEAAKARPDVVLCDIGLPGMDGYAVARAVRAAGLDSIQLIAVTGYAQPEDVKKAVEAGFDAHVAKPPDPAKIERLLQ